MKFKSSWWKERNPSKKKEGRWKVSDGKGDEVILSKGTMRASVSAAYILLLPFWKTAEEIGMSFYHFVKWQKNKTEFSFLDF